MKISTQLLIAMLLAATSFAKANADPQTESTPAENTPAQSVPAKSIPVKSVQAKSNPAKSVPAKVAPANNSSSKSVPSHAAAKHPGGTKKPQAVTAGKTPGATVASSAECNNYATQLRTKMGANWKYPDGKNNVTLTITVAQDGSVSNLSLESTPKNYEAEQKANDAFNSAQPLQALPPGISAATVTALFESQADQWNSKANISVKIDPSNTAAPAGGDTNNSDSAKQ